MVTAGTVSLRLEALSSRLKELELDAFVVPSSDVHLNEYAPRHHARREAITGFTGSAGDALVTQGGVDLFVDSRYYIQADQQTGQADKQANGSTIRVHKVGLSGGHTLSEWLTEMEKTQGPLRVGFFPSVVSMAAHKAYGQALKSSESKLVPIEQDLVASVWDDRPPAPATRPFALPESLTGRSAQDKLSAVRKEMRDSRAWALVVTRLDEIAWLTNLRGADVEHNPVFEAYLLLTEAQALCFVHVRPDAAALPSLGGAVEFLPYGEYQARLKTVAAQAKGKIWIDPAGTTMGTRLLLPQGDGVHESRSPIVFMKAIKNQVELEAARAAHLHSAAAKIRSLAATQRAMDLGRTVSEKSYADLLYAEYRSEPGFHDLSFTTIAAAGADAAVVHYAEASADIPVKLHEMFLVDSGIQLAGATTDDTRTVCFGQPDRRQQELFTLVLKGHIHLARQRFPEGTTGSLLDAYARGPLWDRGLDYGHGTGHGVGAFLNVHEGPHSISPRRSDEGFKAGMIVSDEPGYYEQGWGGIRLENLLVAVEDMSLPNHPSGRPWLRFEVLTLIPFDKKLIAWDLLLPEDVSWLREYHRRVWQTIGPLLVDAADCAWLKDSCTLPGETLEWRPPAVRQGRS